MGNLLFSPNGRLNKQDFIKGAAIIAGVYAILSLVGVAVKPLSVVLGLLGFLLFIPFIFIMIKRSHDGGKSGWLSIVWLLLWALIVGIFYTVAVFMFEGELIKEYFSLFIEATEAGDQEAAEAINIEYGEKIEAALGMKLILVGFIGSMAGAYFINFLTGKDFEENQYGPVV